uniref:Exonuclease domain-containing protein n=1 Tax=Anopheles farauti TaxID=69004 RepID=A0A182Q4Y8_9DIPT
MVEIKSFVFFDLETTGIPEHEHFRTKITELSLVACARDHLLESSVEQPRVTHKLSLCFNPSRMITLGSSQVTGLYNDLLEKESKFDSTAGELVKLFLDRLQKPICLIAHNGNRFDFILLKQQMLQIAVSLPKDLYCLDSLCAFREIEADIERSYFETNEGMDSEIPELEYQAVQILEQLEQANDWMKERQRMNETTPKSGHIEQKFKQALRAYLNVLPEEGDDNGTGESSPSSDGGESSSTTSAPSKARKRLFSAAFPTGNPKATPALVIPPMMQPKKRYNLSELYKRTVGKELIRAHRAEDDVLALLDCAIVHAARFVRYAEANCISYDEVRSKF